jgi:hypothetical protein
MTVTIHDQVWLRIPDEGLRQRTLLARRSNRGERNRCVEPINRRAFIARSGAVAAAAGAAVLIPGQIAGAVTRVSGGATAKNVVAPAVTRSVKEPAAPIIAHLRNASTGEIAVFSGSEEFILHDPELAARLAIATEGR